MKENSDNTQYIEPNDIARRFGTKPGFQLIDFNQVALPIFVVPIDAIVIASKPLQLVDEFLLRSVAEGIDTLEEVAGFLGLETPFVKKRLGELIGRDLLAYGPDAQGVARAVLTEKGTNSLKKALIVQPKRESFNLAIDGITRQALATRPSRLLALRFSLATPAASKILVRVPAWAAKPMAILVNNKLEMTEVPGTYATLERTWNDGDTITFTLPAELQMPKYTGKEASPTQPRFALEYGPILLAAVGASADSPEARFAFDSTGLLKRLKPKPGQPLHFSIGGEPNDSYIPYWEVTNKQMFTCFPFVVANADSHTTRQ